MASNHSAKNKAPIGQLIGLLVILMLLISLSTLGTLMVLGVVSLGAPDQPVGSLIEAEAICDQRIRGDQGNKLNAFNVDDFSSRYDAQTGLYKMFYEMDVYRDDNHQTGVDHYYVNCFVGTEDGKIERLEYHEEMEFKGKPIRRTKGNAIGL